jgi:hypothetical protein
MRERIGSILKGIDGIIRFASPAEDRMDITFDDWKTDAQQIAQALVKGGLVVRTTPEPVW